MWIDREEGLEVFLFLSFWVVFLFCFFSLFTEREKEMNGYEGE